MFTQSSNSAGIPSDQNLNIGSIEMLRGIACTMVCLFHFTNGNGNFISEGSWIKAITSKGWLGVEVFFVISGFIIPYAMAQSRYRLRDLPWFIFRRWVRIDPPFWASIFLVIGMNALATAWLSSAFTLDWSRLFLHFGYLVPFFPPHQWLNGVYWSLAVEFQYYLLIAFLYPMLFRHCRVCFWLITAALLYISIYTSRPDLVSDYLMFFMLGFALFWRSAGGMRGLEFYVFSFIVFLAINYKFSLQYVLAGLFPWLLIAFWPGLRVRGFCWLGMISYSLYLIHLPLAKTLIPWAARHIDGDGPRLVFVGFLFCLAVSLAYGFYRLVEQPAVRWSKKVRKSGVTQEPPADRLRRRPA